MSTEYNTRLLGRIPSTPDERDYPLSLFLQNGTALDNALKALTDSHVIPKAAKVWAKLATQAIEGVTPTPPSPSPTPDPTPVPSVPIWREDGVVLDQGDFGTCVGNGWGNFGNTLPVGDHFTEADARQIYYEATKIDGHPDNPDAPGGGQQGSTVRSGAKAMQNRKRINAYAFADDLDVMLQWLNEKGPVVIGSDWLNNMFTPDASGLVTPSGPVEGGHCYLAVGRIPQSKLIVFQNSWGPGWGAKIGDREGRFTMAEDAFNKLVFEGNGEVCTAVELAA